jgi:hypothetical protein
MILGFGATERETARTIIHECATAIKHFPENAQEAIQSVQKKYNEDEERYKQMTREEAPERYSYFWASFHSIYEGKYIIEFTFHHINRRHAFSQDGWALLVTQWILGVQADGTEKIFREA